MKFKVNNRAVWAEKNIVYLIDQIKLPFKEEVFVSETYKKTCEAIKNMITRGAGSIGATAAFAMMQAAFEAPETGKEIFLHNSKTEIENTRPTAQDLFAAVERVYNKALISTKEAEKEAHKIADETSLAGKKIGEYGNALIKDGYNILTHCNAGPLALVEYGSALAPIIKAHESGKKIFVYVDETRPRNQGAKLTAWELNNAGVPHKIIADNVAGLLMLQGKIDIVITGADRIACNGDTANKIGTLEKAVLAKEFNVPFYVAAPDSTFDKKALTGKDIPIEERSEDEVLYITGQNDKGNLQTLQIASPGSAAYNPAFDVTPFKYITGFITSHGIINNERI
ncbi:MAG: S-methyl-5-thioribose-1-phosphate isomerase [Bacteroidales bacterium]|nr:S-methyl-5-thioribose-1-phosphate isomerase [Bacteroidales bacterium]